MPGIRFRISELPEQPGERRIPSHWFFLPIGLLFVFMGVKGLLDSFRLMGPTLEELHRVNLANVTNVIAEPDVPGSTKIDYIWLQTSDGVKIRYRNRFPHSSEILRLNPNYSLLLDKTNRVWAITTGGGEILGRRYFDDYNIEAKTVGKHCGGFLGIIGAGLLFCFFVSEKNRRAGVPMPQSLPAVRLRQAILLGSIIGYFIICMTVVFPLLSGKVSGLVLALIWVLGAGLMGNGIVAYFRKHPPRQG